MTSLEIKKLERKVLDFIQIKFQGKTDKGGTEYIQHLWNVAESVENEGKKRSNWYDYGESSLSLFYHKAYIVALLHDIIEDTDTTYEQLEDIGCDEEIVEAIKSVTHNKNENYFDFIVRSGKNDIGRIVKRYDLENNMDITRLKEFGEYEMKRLQKYWYSWMYLKGEKTEIEVHNTLYQNDKWR